MTPMYYRAKIAFEFGGVHVAEGEPVPVHRAPWSTLLSCGGLFVEPVYPADALPGMWEEPDFEGGWTDMDDIR